MHASAAESRIDWVDHAKGICIVLVVMMHSTLGVEKAAGAEGWMHVLVQFAKPFRMPDFFLISGLFLASVIDRLWRRYLDRKVVHFLYFYLLWTAIQFALKTPAWLGEGQSPGEIGMLLALSFIEPFGTLWFIYMLPVFFVVTRLLKGVAWPVLLGAAALLEMLPIHTGWLLIDEFASRYVYFLAGWLFAPQVFALANRVRANIPEALLLLAAWALANFTLAFTPAPQALIAALGNPAGMEFVADLPVVSLALGAAGAMAIIAISSLIAATPALRAAGWLGRHSIVIYLAFFLPMAVARAVLLKFAPFLDIGTVSLLVTIAAVAGPAVLYMAINLTGWGRFLFERPNWARIEPAPAGKPRFAPAE